MINGALDDLKDYVYENLDSLFLLNSPGVSKEQEIELELSTIKNVKTIGYLRKENFQNVTLSRDFENRIRIKLSKKYITFEKTPTYHYLSYYSDTSEIQNPRYTKIDMETNWYFMSFDDNEYDNDLFLQII
ncbi:MAG: hypothetical protein AAF575_00630 [Bacteroidota bacterium]